MQTSVETKDKVEGIFNKVESFFEKQIQNFEEAPIKTSIRVLVVVFIVKKLYSWYKEA